jgi:trigger factor
MKKKAIAGILAAGLLLAAIGCNNNDEKNPDGSVSVTTTTADDWRDCCDEDLCDCEDDFERSWGEFAMRFPDYVPEEHDDLTNLPPYSFSAGRDEDGSWSGINALDHVTLAREDYFGIDIPFHVHTITDDALDWEMDSMPNYYPLIVEQITDRPIADGDRVSIEYVGSVDGVEFTGGNSFVNPGEGKTVVTAGSDQFIGDFLTQIIGRSPGETFDVSVSFPNDYHAADLAGKPAVFVTTINYIVGKEGELDDEYVAHHFEDMLGWTTVAELRDGLRDIMLREQKERFFSSFFWDNMEVDVPDELLERLTWIMIGFYQDYAANPPDNAEFQPYTSFDDYLRTEKFVTHGLRELVDENHSNHIRTLHDQLVLQAIAEDAGLTPERADIDAWIDERRLGDYDEVVEKYGIPFVMQSAMQHIVFEYVFENGVHLPEPEPAPNVNNPDGGCCSDC